MSARWLSHILTLTLMIVLVLAFAYILIPIPAGSPVAVWAGPKRRAG